MFNYDMCIVGGCGRVGLPLSIAFADKGLRVVIYDKDLNRLAKVKSGMMPFLEEGCEEKLRRAIGKNLTAVDGPDLVSECKFVIVTVGTPVEEHLNPLYSAMLHTFQDLAPRFVKGQYIILRSTVYPGTAERIHEFLKSSAPGVKVAMCPERIAEGKALAEFASLPQIVSGFDEETVREVSDLFRMLTTEIVVLEPVEAELAKLFTNAWRYMQFATANQFFMLADQHGLDYHKIFHAMTYKYPRTQGLPGPGFAAGPCLFKDTMQLSAFGNNSFFLGHAAMLINEGLPNYIVQRLKDETDIRDKNVGILGMAFKANSDDDRDSLSFKLKKVLELEANKVYCSDPYVKRDYFIDADKLIDLCDIIILAAPHEKYRHLQVGKEKKLVDIWNFFGRGGFPL
jgi:UDP-N-acetyl-D-mannosaminuronic acid dehydrogenase